MSQILSNYSDEVIQRLKKHIQDKLGDDALKIYEEILRKNPSYGLIQAFYVMANKLFDDSSKKK